MALGTTTNNGATSASALTHEQIVALLIRPLEEKSVFLSAAPRIFDNNGSPLKLIKQSDPISPSWVGENEQVPESNPSFSNITLLPQQMKSVATMVRISNQEIRQSVVDAVSAVGDRIVTDLANKIDVALIASTVTDGTNPTGILSYSGVQTLSVGGALTLDHLITAYGMALGSNVNVNNVRLICRPETFTALSLIKDTTGRPLLQPDLTQGAAFRVWGVPVIVSNHVPVTGASGSHVTKAVLADFSQIAVARDTAPSVVIDRSRFVDFRQTLVLAECRYDAAPLNPQAVVRLDGITAQG